MNPETNTTPFGTTDPALHLEYLYGPQWHEVVRIVERAAQLTADEHEKLNAQAEEMLKSQMSAFSGGNLTDLLSKLGGTSASEAGAMQIASDTAKAFGRARNVQISGVIAGQSISSDSQGGALASMFSALSSIGVMTVVSQAITAAVLGDLVGHGQFTQDVYDELMKPWRSVIS